MARSASSIHPVSSIRRAPARDAFPEHLRLRIEPPGPDRVTQPVERILLQLENRFPGQKPDLERPDQPAAAILPAREPAGSSSAILRFSAVSPASES